MVEAIVAVIFVGSIAGMVMIGMRRMPTAKQASERSADFKLANIIPGLKVWVEARIKKTPYFKDFSWIDFLQKHLLKAKLLILKAENKVNEYIVRLRQRAEAQSAQKEARLDNYWHDLKTIVKTTQKSVLSKKNTNNKIQEAVKGEKIKADHSITLEKPTIVENDIDVKKSASEPMIGRVVMPEDVLEKPVAHQKKKRSANSKKRKLRDPFSW
ncbi:MAG: hypothetical protein WCX69_00200 [Candidatus Paceibacterota bacterium]